jgi:hypothetical protein
MRIVIKVIDGCVVELLVSLSEISTVPMSVRVMVVDMDVTARRSARVARSGSVVAHLCCRLGVKHKGKAV